MCDSVAKRARGDPSKLDRDRWDRYDCPGHIAIHANRDSKHALPSPPLLQPPSSHMPTLTPTPPPHLPTAKQLREQWRRRVCTTSECETAKVINLVSSALELGHSQDDAVLVRDTGALVGKLLYVDVMCGTDFNDGCVPISLVC